MRTVMKSGKHVWLAGMILMCGVVNGASSGGPVVVELFESQGCSSCPPSERVMSRLKQEFGESVLLLTFHVDYWDYLGWKDAFSDPRNTERQKMYGRAFAQDSIYTPEMVIGGESGFNGSDLGQAQQEIRERLSSERPLLQVSLSPKTSHVGILSVHLPKELASGAREMLAVMIEDAQAVQVLRGENRGVTMSGQFAVRSIVMMPAPSNGLSRVRLTLPSDANSDRVHVAVLVRGDSSKILSAASVPWTAEESKLHS